MSGSMFLADEPKRAWPSELGVLYLFWILDVDAAFCAVPDVRPDVGGT